MMYFRRMKLKSYLIIFVAFFIYSSSFSQANITVSGNIINDATGAPMAAASVFAQNTTLGTVTDKEGNFMLQLPAGGYDLIITYTGFKTESRRITSSEAAEKINIRLKEKEKELEVVSVVSSNEVLDGLTKYGQFFKDEFIGKSTNSKQCSIENPEVLHFFFSKKKNRLKITATEPLLIKNLALGYNIRYSLDSFTHEYKTEVSTFTGFPLYEKMLADSITTLQWQQARAIAFKGSTLHFMRSLYNKDLKIDSFNVQFIITANGKEEAMKLKDVYAALNYEKDDSTQTVEIMPNQPNVGILYLAAKPSVAFLSENKNEPKDFRFSILIFKPTESIVIEQNGYFYDQNDISISGYWSWEKIADQLPYDYKEE